MSAHGRNAINFGFRPIHFVSKEDQRNSDVVDYVVSDYADCFR
jgi:hypothetical protein